MTADVEALIRRHTTAKGVRDTLSWVQRDCYAYTMPLRGARWSTGGASVSAGGTAESGWAQAAQAVLYDETGADAARILASALKDGACPPSSQWFELEVDGASDADALWLEKAGERLWKLIHNSNFDAVAFETKLDLVIAGMAVLFVDEDRREGGFLFEQWDAADCTWSAPRPGALVDRIYREHTQTAEQCLAEFGERCTPRIRELATKEPNAAINLLRCIYPREIKEPGRFALNMAFASVTISRDDKVILRESGYPRFPCVVPRWMIHPGTDYGVGPCYFALPALRQVNETVRLQILGLELHAGAGTYKATDDGVLNPRTIKLGNRRVIIVGDINNLVPLSQAGDLKQTLIDIERLQKGIRKVFMADALEPADADGSRTATEINVRVDMIRQQLGPMYGREQSEFLAPLVELCFGMALDAGAFPPLPPSLDKRPFRVKFTSPLARAQRIADVQAIDNYVISTANDVALDSTVVDNVDVGELNRIRAERLGVPREAIRDRVVVEQMKRQRAQAQRAQEAQALQAVGAQALDNGQPATAATAMGAARAR